MYPVETRSNDCVNTHSPMRKRMLYDMQQDMCLVIEED